MTTSSYDIDINLKTRFFSKIYIYFHATFSRKLNSALFDRSHCSWRRSETMCLCRSDWLFAPTIQYQFKRRLFSRRPCTGPYLWACPGQDCSDWQFVFQLVLICVVTHLPRCPRVLRRRSISSDLMSRKGCSVLMAIGCPSAPDKIKQVQAP